MDVGILGGTFDPVHTGHVKMAEAAYAKLSLDEVIFVPAGNPPHKEGKDITDFARRMDMIRIAISDFPRFKASDMERARSGPSYTADTLEYFVSEYPDNAYTFILGEDSLFYIDEWYMPEKIMRCARLAVCARNGAGGEKGLSERISFLEKRYGARIAEIDFTPVDISSSEIRKNIRENPESVRKYVPDGVYDYIIKEGLYRNGI